MGELYSLSRIGLEKALILIDQRLLLFVSNIYFNHLDLTRLLYFTK